MPNIDTSTIENFDSMTDAEKVAALLGVEIPEKVDLTKYVEKSVFDKKASEAADWKHQHDSVKAERDNLLSEDEKNKRAESEEKAALLAKVEALEKENMVKDYTNKYLALDYDPTLAAETARAMADGDMEKVFANSEKHKAALEAKIKAELMKNDPKPGGAGAKNDGETAAIEQAKRIGNAKAVADKSTADVLSHYIK